MEFVNAHFITLLKIKKHRNTTISQLAKDTGFNIPKTTSLVNELLDNFKLIKVTGSGKPAGGRPPKIFSINPDLGKVIGIDIGGENTRVIITDFNGNILISKKDKTVHGSDYDKTFSMVFSLIGQILLETNTNIKDVLGIGISISGFIQRETGICINSPNIGWGNVNVKDIFEKKYNKITVVDDSVRCETIAEKIFGAAWDVQSFIFVSIGIGIGAGIFIRDNIYRGETGLAGELGHIIVTESITPRCSCGNFGCLETISSGRGIVEQTKKSIKDGVNTSLKKMVNNDLSKLTVKLINEAAERGDKFSYQILDKAGDYIGRGITTMLNLFGPKLVIIGSGVSNCGNILFDAIIRSIKIRTLEHISKQVEIIKTKLDDNAAAQGAVIFVIDEIFNSKLLFERKV